MRPALTPTLLALALLTTFTAAQTLVVSPRYHRRSEGLTSNVFPFGNTAVPFRYAQIHDDVPAMTVSGLAFRHNAAVATTYPSHSITLDAWASTAASPAAGITLVFDNNHGANKAQVITNRTFNHPISDTGTVPGAFILQYPFDTPFVHTSAVPLCWEVQVTAKSQTASVTHDAFTGLTTNPSLQLGRAGSGCRAVGATADLTATGTSTMNWPMATGVLTVTGANAVVNGPAVHALGFDKANWGGLPLPFELPGTGSAPSGRCLVYNDVVLTNVVIASPTGTITSNINVPATVNLNGTTTYSQLWDLDAAANSFGLVTSPMVVHNFVAPTPNPPASRVYLSGSLGASGTASATSGLVTRFL